MVIPFFLLLSVRLFIDNAPLFNQKIDLMKRDLIDVKRFIAAGANVIAFDMNGWTSLMLASEFVRL